jgi:hypothetical protein
MIHVAGPMTHEGLQRCTRCGEILTDYRHAMIPDGDPPLVGWAEDACIEVLTGNPRFSGVTTDPPDCETLQ